MEGVLEGLSEKGSLEGPSKGREHLPWKGHNSGKPLLVTRLDATPSELVARILSRFFRRLIQCSLASHFGNYSVDTTCPPREIPPAIPNSNSVTLFVR